MIDERFIIIAVILSAIGTATYAYSTFKGKTKPNRVTWFLWALAPLIAFFAQLNQGVGIQIATTFIAGFGPLLVLSASFLNKKAYWKISRLDIMCGAISILALLLWIATKEPNIALLFSIIADFMASVPTVIKAYTEPETEHPDIFRNGAISAGITLLTVKTWTFETYGFALYILLICLVLYTLIRFKLGKRLNRL